MKRWHIFTVIGTTAAMLLLAGCGGGGGLYGGGGGSSGSGLVASITISPATSSIAVNGTQQYMAVAKDSNGNTLSGVTYTWASSSNAVATVNTNGLATAVAAGTAMITASVTYSGGIYGGMGTTITSNSATLTVTAAGMVMGTAAMGQAFTGALVTLKDSSGQMQTATTDAQGRFQLAVSGMQAPYILKLADSQGHVLFSLGNEAGVINIDPFTDVIARLWYQAHGSNVGAAFTNPNSQAVPDNTSLESLDNALVQFLSDAETAQGLDPTALSLAHTPFIANGMGLDGLLDRTTVSTSGADIVLNNLLMARQMITISTTTLTVTFRASAMMNAGMNDGNMMNMGMMGMNMGAMASLQPTELTIHFTH